MENTQHMQQELLHRNLSAVARATGLSPHTLYRIAKGTSKPRKATLMALENYLKKGAANNG